MELRDVVPRKEVELRFQGDLVTEEYAFPELDKIIAVASEEVYGTAMNVWNRIVTRRLRAVDPQALADCVETCDPRTYREIERIIEASVITDCVYYDASAKGEAVARVILFRVFPNSLHLADVVFQDPSAPLPAEDRTALRTYRGLGLLPAVVERMKRFAAEQGVEFLTLTAASRELLPLFERQGFTVENNFMGQLGLKTGLCIPMEMNVHTLGGSR